MFKMVVKIVGCEGRCATYQIAGSSIRRPVLLAVPDEQAVTQDCGYVIAVRQVALRVKENP